MSSQHEPLIVQNDDQVLVSRYLAYANTSLRLARALPSSHDDHTILVEMAEFFQNAAFEIQNRGKQHGSCEALN